MPNALKKEHLLIYCSVWESKLYFSISGEISLGLKYLFFFLLIWYE